MKKTTLILIAATALLFFGASVYETSAPVFAETDGKAAAPTAEETFTLRESGGMVIIEHGDEVFVTDIAVSAMRDYDRRLLFDGIKADSMEEALMLLEDLGS